MKHLLTYFKNMDPTSLENVGSNYSLGQEWYNTVTGDKFYHKSDGVWVKSITDVSSLIIEVTYGELDALKTDSLLIPGRVYLLTDYMTRYEQPVSGDIISSGVVEPLYITATGVNTLSNICMSKLYPQDIVYYEITGDIDNGEGTEGFNKGKIYRRIDTIRNNDIGTDWRHVKYRRYALNVNNTYATGNNYSREDVVNEELNIYICVEDDPNSTTLNSKKWFRYMYNNGSYKSLLLPNEVPVHIYSSYSPDAAIIPVDSADYEDYLLFPVIDGSDYYENGDIYNNTINTYNLSNNVIYGRFNNNTINTNRFTNNNIGMAERNHINFEFGENNLGSFIGNSVICSTETNSPFGKNHIKNFQENQVSSSFRSNFIISTNFRWNTFGRDFVGNTIRDDIQNSNIGEYVSSNLITGTFNNVNISYNFLENKIRRSFASCNFNGGFRYFDIPEIFPDLTITSWSFNGYLIGTGISLPVIADTYIPTMYVAGGSILVKYDDENGDTIILGQPESFSFRSNQEYFAINGNNSTSAIVRIDWGNGAVWASTPDTSFSTSNTYTGKLNTDELSVSIGGNYITHLFMANNQLTYFNPINLPSSLQELNLDSNLLTSFNPSIALPSSIIGLYINFNLLTSFDPSIALPSSLQYLVLGGNLLTSFDPTLPLPSGLIELTLGANQLTVFNPTQALPFGLNTLNIFNNQITSFDPSIALPSSITSIRLDNNLLTSFDPSITLPGSLRYLYLDYNLLTSFNPSIALPDLMEYLVLNNNQLTSFDPIIALPSSLQYLFLQINQLTSFNPSIALPSSLININLQNNALTSFDPSIALPSSLTTLNLQTNPLTSFDPSIALPGSLTYLNLVGNHLTSFNPSITLPSSLLYLNLQGSTLLTSFDPSIALPSSLLQLELQNCNLTSFNPSIALPSSLRRLYLEGNELTSFNPSIALPSSLEYLYLSSNHLTSFNPTIPLPSSLKGLYISYNQLNTTEVNNTLVMLNARYTAPGYKEFALQMSPSAPPSGAGLTAKTALQAKGYNVLTN